MANGTLIVSNIQTSSGSGTITLGQSGETVTIASGVTQTVAVNTPAFEAYVNSTLALSNDTITKVTFDTENFDTDSDYDNSTNYRFTPTVAGKYYVYSFFRWNSSTDVDSVRLYVYKNGSSILKTTNRQSYYDVQVGYCVVDMNGSTDYIEIFAYQNSGGSFNISTGAEHSRFGAYKIIGA